MRKGITFIAFLLLLLTSINLKAQDSGTGIGIIIGNPTGISGKHYLNDNNAIDLGLGYSLVSGKEKFTMHIDYLYQLNNFFETKEEIALYYGFGARFNAQRYASSSFGARGVIGSAFFLEEQPIDIFAEAAPVFNLLPETSIDFDLGIGIRYYFK
jgi:hypothetical protein